MKFISNSGSVLMTYKSISQKVKIYNHC